MAQIEICGQPYTLARPTAGTFRRIAKMTGLPMPELSGHVFMAVVAWVAVSADIGLDEAASLLEEHIDAGNGIDDILERMNEEINKFSKQIIRHGGKMHEKTKIAFFEGK